MSGYDFSNRRIFFSVFLTFNDLAIKQLIIFSCKKEKLFPAFSVLCLLTEAVKSNGELQRTWHLYWLHWNVLPVMSDDREMSVSNIHPITFNHRLRHTSKDESQIAKIKGGNCWQTAWWWGWKKIHRSIWKERAGSTLSVPHIWIFINSQVRC